MLADEHDRDCLIGGEPPRDLALLDWLTVGSEVWEDFAIREYLDRFIQDGGSQFKLIIGRPGSGKTHLLRRLEKAGLERNYLVASLSARTVRLQRIDDLYRAIIQHIDLPELTKRLAHWVLKELGYPEAPLDEQPFVDWAVKQGRIRESLLREVRECRDRFFRQRDIDTSLCLAFIQLASHLLGATALSQENEQMLYAWIRGEKLTARDLESLSLKRSVDRFNARDLLDSIARFARSLDYCGLVVLIDQSEDLLSEDKETGKRKYTKSALNDVYQSLREFIDSMPTMTSVWLVVAGRRELLDDDHQNGIKSYDALWLRLQHEVGVPSVFNRFGQIIDLDKAYETLLKQEHLTTLYSRVNEAFEIPEGERITPSEEVISPYGAVGQLRRIVQAATSRTRQQ